MIEARGLTKSFGSRVAVSDVSFTVNKGEIVGFLGPNGAGKTTTMRMLTGFFPPTAGSGSVGGLDIFRDSLKVRERIGYLPETPPVYRDMTVDEYLDFVARIRGVKSAEVDERIDEAILTCGLKDVAHRLIGNLSKGYRQRVGLAQALVHRPDVLILDEPTAGLDPKQIREIRDLVTSLRGQRTIILSTHILPEVAQTCERVIVIHEGRVVATDRLENLEAAFRKSERIQASVKRFSEKLVPALEAIGGVSSVKVEAGSGPEREIVVETALHEDLREEIVKALVAGDFGLVGLRTVTMSLEDVFVKLTTSEAGDQAPDRSAAAPASEATA